MYIGIAKRLVTSPKIARGVINVSSVMFSTARGNALSKRKASQPRTVLTAKVLAIKPILGVALAIKRIWESVKLL